MKFFSKLMLCLLLFATINSCKDNSTNPTNSAFKGFIYYSTASTIYRINMTTQKSEKLFENARYPDITKKGEILAQETYQKRLMLSDLTGANRVTVMEGTDYQGPVYRRGMDHPRISYDQKYIAYDGGSVYNPVTYVIDATNGSLVATIGDYSARNPLYMPSWAPDGTLYVMGWTSMNNGIYKVSADFKTVTRIDPNLTNVAYPSVSPDGKKIAFVRDGQVWTMGIDGMNPKQLYVQNETFYNPAWSPDSKYIVATDSYHAFIFDIANNTVTELDKAGYISPDDQFSWVY